VLQQIAPGYISSGKAKFVYHNYAVIGQESVWAAQAAECAGDQNKFWLYAVTLFEHQGGENTGAFTQSNLKQLAGQLGLNTTTFNSCLDSGKYQASVQQQLAQGQQRGVRATPTFFINGKMYEGVLPADQLSSLIDAAAAP
jgi:protein-disulfide isomerase